jgi:hypothetical protein
MSVIFLKRMRKSYQVSLSPNFKYLNDRPPHVETDLNNLSGQTYQLGERTEKQIGNSTSVMYQIIGLTNGSHPAHITTYYGPQENAHEY